ncbi:MAG: protein translocase subunit SecF [Ilumatobacteraceae bacterium]
MSATVTTDRPNVAKSAIGRLIDVQTAIDFVGRRMIGLIVSAVLIVATVISLWAQGLNLGIDFEGGVSWDIPVVSFTVDDAEQVLADNGLGDADARIQVRESESGQIIKVQVGSQPEEVGLQLREAFAEAADVEVDTVSVNLVSSSWGDEITGKAIRALVIFVLLVAIFISIRFEWRMAIAAIIAMLHDVLISVGIYSIFQFVVTPPTVIAFLTILGYSLYDTIVVFDRVKENEARFAARKPPYDDIINVSMNQVLMRSLTTSFSSIVPVISLLLIGAGILGQATLAEFALALLIGMITGVYSSIFVAAPLLGVFKQSDKSWGGRNIPRAVGEPLRDMVMGGDIGSRKTRQEAVAAKKAPAVTTTPSPSRPVRRRSARPRPRSSTSRGPARRSVVSASSCARVRDRRSASPVTSGHDT